MPILYFSRKQFQKGAENKAILEQRSKCLAIVWKPQTVVDADSQQRALMMCQFI